MNNKFKIGLVGISLIGNVFLSAYISMVVYAYIISDSISKIHVDFNLMKIMASIIKYPMHLYFFAGLYIFLTAGSIFIIYNFSNFEKTKLKKITKDIEVPIAYGEKQHGSARFLKENEYDTVFDNYKINPNRNIFKKLIETGYDDLKGGDEDWNNIKILNNKDIEEGKKLFKEKGGGIVAGMSGKNTEKIYYLSDDTHSLCIGATGSGKSRHLVIQTICTLGLSGESLLVTDPKRELFDYTNVFMKKLGYNVVFMDFKNPEKSMSYNFLQPIIDAANNNDRAKMEASAWDLVQILVGEPTGNQEKIWVNGELSVIAAAVISVVWDNRKRPKFQTMSNVYYFMGEMCKDVGGIMPIELYIQRQEPTHPARPLLYISNLAPSRVRGSFYTSAMTTLKLFSGVDMYNISYKSDFSLASLGEKKTIFYIILPDERTTYYPIASLIVTQLYLDLVVVADKHGGRLPIRVNNVLDEFGNFATIDNFDTKLTVSRSRGIRYYLFLQSFKQLEVKYTKELAGIIAGNCHNWIYLWSADDDTNKKISETLGNYTTSSYSFTSSKNIKDTSQSVNFLQRPLLTHDEVGRIKRPYQLFLTNNPPAMMTSAGLEKWFFNSMLGLGDVKHNEQVRIIRDSKRVINTNNKKIQIDWDNFTYWQDLAKAITESRK